MDSESSESQDNEGAVARYANYFEIGHNAAEFILDFGQAYSSSEERHMHMRIVTSPVCAIAFLRLLEKQFSDGKEYTEPSVRRYGIKAWVSKGNVKQLRY
ncbi:MAG: DUF3467 domain-containing protein [Nitrospira sp.]|jgi:hypothetical protein|nr:DUF3467 domain-containing protein [Nitrospira sp.]